MVLISLPQNTEEQTGLENRILPVAAPKKHTLLPKAKHYPGVEGQRNVLQAHGVHGTRREADTGILIPYKIYFKSIFV